MEIIDKLAWIEIKDKKVLFVRSRGKEVFYTPGGKRQEGETDIQALRREVKEELDITVMTETINYLHTFRAQAHDKPEGVLVEITCYTAGYEGNLQPSTEIEELAWLTSAQLYKTSTTGALILGWLKERNLID